MARYDVVIVGAGPAGSSLAMRLSRRGRSVLVVDGARFPRSKPCGEGIQPAGVAALEELGLGPALAGLVEPFEGIRYRLPDGTAAEGRFPGGARGWGITRGDLDARLLEAAWGSPGVSVQLGAWVRGFERRADGVRLDLGGRAVEAALLVGADGHRSTVRRLAGLEAPPPAVQRFGVVGHVSHAPAADPFVEVYVGRGVELYTTPVRPGLTCVALLVDRDGLAPLQGRLEAGLREALAGAAGRCRDLARGRLVGQVRALGPLAGQASRAHADRLLLVGDAAGGLDPITGEGISLALCTGASAAEVIDGALGRGDCSARALAPWTSRRRAEVRALANLTWVVLRTAAAPARAERVIRALAAAPATFERVLGVAAGVAPLSSLTLRDGVRVLLGV